jgi:hypothetical protein
VQARRFTIDGITRDKQYDLTKQEVRKADEDQGGVTFRERGWPQKNAKKARKGAVGVPFLFDIPFCDLLWQSLSGVETS